jgi:AcrR family transcriptional regulator
MAQYLKEEVATRIRDAALEVFAGRGFLGASMADIARAAGVSTGNLYRYFASKEVLFEVVLPPSVPRRLLALLRLRMRALEDVRSIDARPPSAAYTLASEELLAFSIRHRLALIVLLERADGSPYADFPARIRRLLQQLAVMHARALAPERALDATLHQTLELAYDGFVRAMARILMAHHDEPSIRSAVATYTRYHLGGLSRLLAP